MQYEHTSSIFKKSDKLASYINQVALFPFPKLEKEKYINDLYREFEILKKTQKNKIWVWDENYEHYELDEVLLLLKDIWTKLDIKQKVIFITSDIHTDYSHVFEYGEFYFTLHNMRLHHRRRDFIHEYPAQSLNKIFVQGGSQRIDRTYIAEQFKKFIPDEFYISTISENPYNQGATSDGKMKYSYKEMFKLIHDSNILFVNETIRPPSEYFNGSFTGKATGYTEKTGNAIIFKKAFFINSNPYSLYNLKQMGFKTFSEFWDESYDDKLNQVDRINIIMENIKWLSKVNEGGFTKLNRKIKEVTEHNYKHLVEEMCVYEGYKLYKPSEFNFKL